MSDKDKQEKEEQIRFSADIPKSLSDRLNTYCPWGTKGEVVRQLLLALDDAVQNGERGKYAVVDLLDGKMKLIKRKL